MQNWGQQDKAKQEIITFIQSKSFGRKSSNKASSSSNFDSAVGCSLKLFRSLARDCLATLPKGNMQIWKPRSPNYTASQVHCYSGSNQSATQFRFWTDFSHGNEVPCLCDQRSVSGSLSNRKQEKHRGGWGIRTNSPKSYLVKFSGGNFFGLISSFSSRVTEVRSQKTVLTSLVFASSVDSLEHARVLPARLIWFAWWNWLYSKCTKAMTDPACKESRVR